MSASVINYILRWILTYCSQRPEQEADNGGFCEEGRPKKKISAEKVARLEERFILLLAACAPVAPYATSHTGFTSYSIFLCY